MRGCGLSYRAAATSISRWRLVVLWVVLLAPVNWWPHWFEAERR